MELDSLWTDATAAVWWEDGGRGFEEEEGLGGPGAGELGYVVAESGLLAME